jgi:putative ABC transport system ATP-binding protein
MPAPLVQLNAVSKEYVSGSGEISRKAVDGVDLAIAPGEIVAILGRSGSGKSTLLNLIAGLDRPTAGKVLFSATDLGLLNENALARWRGRQVGIVFQFFQLLPTLTALENVVLAMDFAGVIARCERRNRAFALLQRVGIAEQANKLPSSLSGGQQQRVAIARALANTPALLIADEPTGNLDSQTATGIVELFTELATQNVAVLIVTHDESVAARAHRIVRLADGRVITDRRVGAAA